MPDIIHNLKRIPGKKTWVAAITGKCRKFGLSREFLGSLSRYSDSSDYLLEDGCLYEVCEMGIRYFGEAIVDVFVLITRENAIRKAGEIELARNEEIDDAIDRINFDAEGGIVNRSKKVTGQRGGRRIVIDEGAER